MRTLYLYLLPCALWVSLSFSEAEGMFSPDSGLGPNVWMFDPSMDQEAMQARLDALHSERANAEFTSERTALLFLPGTYELDVTVDYYVQALGLGRVPGDVVINGTVQSVASTHGGNVTSMFWRGAENMTVVPLSTEEPVLWAVSQAAPYRRMHVKGDVQFDLGMWASGGLLANSIVDGWAGLTTGQQWFTRNSEIGSWRGGNWNRTFVGTLGAPSEADELWPAKPTTVIDRTPNIREKPFLCLSEAGNLGVFVPALQKDTVGVTWRGVDDEVGEWLPLDRFYIADPERDDAESLNAALSDQKDLFFTPGVYYLKASIEVMNPDTVLFGIGLPTLIPTEGTAALKISDVGGVKIAGLVFDAGPKDSSVLVEVGELGSARDHAANPTSLHDLYVRIGGMAAGRAETSVVVHSNDVIGDHFWLWRGDHGEGIGWDVNPGAHGLIVHGDDVTIYGLFNEHYQSYQTLWKGERGRTYFYQCEIPYDPPSNEIWNDEGKPGFAAYKVADSVETHQAWGLGIYSFFWPREEGDPLVVAHNAIEAPEKPGIEFTHISLFTARAGWINHVINDWGPQTENLVPLFIENSAEALSNQGP